MSNYIRSKHPDNALSEKVRKQLEYDPYSGSITWIKNGKMAGCVSKNGYRSIMVAGKHFQAHRIAWFMYYGTWPSMDVDHINGNRSDNRIDNLRDISRRSNIQNMRSPMSNNKSGYLGVLFDKRARFKKWYAMIRHDGKNKCVGYFNTPEEAHEAYVKAKRELHEGCVI